MATGYLNFQPQNALLPTSSFPILKRHASSGTGLPELWILEFANAESNIAFFQFVVPGNFSSTPHVKIYWMADSATTNACRWEISLMCASDDADDLDIAACDTEVAVDDTAPSVAGEWSVADANMTTNDSMAAGDVAIIRVERAGAHANDTLADVAQLIAVVFEYTTT